MIMKTDCETDGSFYSTTEDALIVSRTRGAGSSRISAAFSPSELSQLCRDGTGDGSSSSASSVHTEMWAVAPQQFPGQGRGGFQSLDKENVTLHHFSLASRLLHQGRRCR